MQHFKWSEMTMGVCYYPEHWPKTLWQSDLQRMKQVGISVIRIAEFAWNQFEPEEGVFRFDFFDEFIELCNQEGMKVIFGTPTATPPAWLTENYPESLNATQEGVLYRHGGRRHYNYNSPIYQKFCCRIVTKLAEHYGKNPAVIGWQIDNELNCERNEFYSESDSKAFRVFLQKKYKSLDGLNEAWGTVFWNQTYTDWGQIYVPRPILCDGKNPHCYLDYYRFISDSALRFCNMQAEILRKYKKSGDFITTNGMFGNLDNHKMANDSLDIYMYDSYPNFAFGVDCTPKCSTDLNDRKWTRNLNEVRSICPHFGIMEQQSGANGWVTRMEAAAPRPGQLSLWAMQSVAQGADYISFFRWRTCTIGTEIYWHGILDYDNRDNRKLAEVKEFYKKLKSLDGVCGAEQVAAFALLKDYDNEWDAQVDSWHRRVSWFSEQEIFVASEWNHTPYDVLYLQADTKVETLLKYAVIIYPHPVLMSEERKQLLKFYVEQGGTLIVGCRAGYKDLNGHCVMLPQPGLLQELTGSDIHDFTFTSPNEEATYANWDGEKLETPIFNDILDVVDGGTILAAYANSYYAGKGALVEKKTGKGRTIHFGSCFTRENAAQLFQYVGIFEPFSEYISAPKELEVVLRQKNGRKFLFVLNFVEREVTYELKQKMRLLYDNSKVSGSCSLPAFGTAVYEIETNIC